MQSGRLAGRPALAELIRQSESGDRFLVPGVLCAPVLGELSANGPGLRVLFAMLWFSAESIRSGVVARFQVALAEARVAAGYEKHEKDEPVLSVLEAMREEHFCIQGEAPMRIFQYLGVDRENGATLEWAFTPEFVELFVSPPNFAIVGISELTQLKSGLDFFLYLQLRRIWKMRKSAVDLPAEDIARVAGIASNEGFRRIGERTRRAMVRLQVLLGGRVEVTTTKRLGARYINGVKLEVCEKS